ncbi:MAG: NAD(P)-dependent glycerol-1-phosphate dehydrogenase [Candidatus Helarchaeota archaeon]
MIPAHKINLPSKIIIGHGVIEKIGELCIKLGYVNGNKNVFIVTGPTTFNIAGKKMIACLEDDGYNASYIEVKESNMGYVNWCQDEICNFNPDIVIGLGGGKNIDVAKLASNELGLPFISVPTTLSHDGIASPFASVKGMEQEYALVAQTPIAILADTYIISKAPFRLLAAGIGDILANLTAVLDWKLAHRIKNEYFGHFASMLSQQSAELLLDNYESIKSDEESVRIVLEALITSSIAISVAGSSRPASGSEHLFSHALDKLESEYSLHGEQVGVGTMMMMYLHDGNWRQIQKVLHHVGAPTNAKELRVKDEKIIEALTIAHEMRDRYTIISSGLTTDAAERLARNTGVIE